ncbi:hypothetical protein HW347_17575 [Zobellia sp. KMM 6746]|uniref:Lipocalin-like domain-containing protein n=2 Tax=Zobellia barbeyronii TaxID=2748009 RepID=A0ABS5WI46_9FLAO|nr:hypothetical protein [Zobellia barbeyronii]
MRKLTTLFTFLFVALIFGQENQISESNLIGHWTSEQIFDEDDSIITIYKRGKFSNIGSTGIQFKTTGEYLITYYSRRKPIGRCGTGIRRSNKSNIGYFSLDTELQQLNLDSYDTAPRLNWEVIWLDENSLGIKKPKHNKT